MRAVGAGHHSPFPRPGGAGQERSTGDLARSQGQSGPGAVKGEATLTPEQAVSDGEWYINVHTRDHQAGEIRGQVMPPKS